MTNYKNFPMWIVVTHFVNITCMLFMVRSGLEILSAFPKFYLSDDCPPGKEWLRLTHKVVSADAAHPWISLDEEEAWSPIIALPGSKSLGIGRHWHFLVLQLWVITGAVFISLLFATGWWVTIVPTSWEIVPQALRAAGTYFMLQLPAPLPGLPFNAAQQLTYFLIVFVVAPFQIFTGSAMSPSVLARFPRYTWLFGGRQRARSLHFLGMCAFVGFIALHTLMVILNGLPHLWTVIVLGHQESVPYSNKLEALIVGSAGLAGLVILSVAATVFSRRHPRSVQRMLGHIVNPFENVISRTFDSVQRYKWSDISPYHRVNGYPPADAGYAELAAGDFADYRLEVGGMVEHPMQFSLDQLRALGTQDQIVKHNCIQGWSAIAQWAGVPLTAVMDQVKPHEGATHVAFYAFDDKSATGEPGKTGHYYGTVPLYLATNPQTILAMEMNGKPLPIEHGAPLRLRIETQLGFKMVKWVRAVEFVDDISVIGQGQGGWREDTQFYANAAGI